MEFIEHFPYSAYKTIVPSNDEQCVQQENKSRTTNNYAETVFCMD